MTTRSRSSIWLALSGICLECGLRVDRLWPDVCSAIDRGPGEGAPALYRTTHPLGRPGFAGRLLEQVRAGHALERPQEFAGRRLDDIKGDEFAPSCRSDRTAFC